MKYTIPKGVFDILPEVPKKEETWRTAHYWEYVESVIKKAAQDYGFREIRTPLFERTELFVRGVGESSDIVTKEMFTFEDKAQRSMTLRPEGTASVMRAFIEEHLYQLPGLHKYYYIGPMFRYERPQAGRYRQHHQFGAEAIGIASPLQDVEMIDLLCEVYRRLGLKNLTVFINSVGDESSRTKYKEALRGFLEPFFDQLSADSQVRFTKNALRILDSKDPGDQKILERAPSILDFLSPEAEDHFATVQKYLKQQGISFVVNPKLVRGLDYYQKTVFEITSGELGAQNTVGGGGRFDGLLATLDGPDLPCVGFATGLERLLQTMISQRVFLPELPHPFVFMIPIGQEALDTCFELLSQLRKLQIPAEIDLSQKKVGHAFALADHLHTTYALVIGDTELAEKQAKLKTMETREEQMISFKDLISFFQKAYAKH